MARSKNISQAKKADSQVSPAFICFADPIRRGKVYQWEGWGFVIRELRDLVRMDQTAFGRLVQGYTRGQIARYETEQTEPPIDFWRKLMLVFGLNINWAITGKGKSYIEDFADSEERARFWRWQELVEEKEDFLRQLSGWDQKNLLS